MMLTEPGTIASPAPSLCGCRVVGSDGRVLGVVDDLIVLSGAGGWLLWIAAADDADLDTAPLLIPAAAVARTAGAAVYLDRPGAAVAAAPRYHAGVCEDEFVAELLAYYAAGR